MELGILAMGALVGLLVGLTGVGGASLLTPVLIMLGINPSVAVGTDLVYNSITKFFGTVQHYRQKTIDFHMVRLLAAGSIPGVVIAVVTLRVFHSFYDNQETIIKHALGYVLVIVAIATLFKVFFDHKIKANRWQSKPLEEKKTLTITIGLGIGFIVGMTSIGSGSLFALMFLYFYNLTASRLVGTDIAHAFLLSSVAGILHAGFGNVDYMLVGNLLLGSIPGVIIGSTLSTKAPTKLLRAVIASVVLLSGLKLV
jgi:uncharacterized protein